MAGLAIDGTPVAASTTGATTTQVMPAFTTTGPGLILIAAQVNHGVISSISTSSGLSWAARSIVNDGVVNFDLELWYAFSNLALSSAVTTLTLTGATDFVSASQFSFKNVNKSRPWDINASLPATAQSNTTVSVSTTHPEAAVIGLYRSSDTSTVTQGAGFTLLTGTNFLLAEYKIVTTAQTGLSVATGTIGTIAQAIGDALSGFDYDPPFPPRYNGNLRI